MIRKKWVLQGSEGYGELKLLATRDTRLIIYVISSLLYSAIFLEFENREARLNTERGTLFPRVTADEE